MQLWKELLVAFPKLFQCKHTAQTGGTFCSYCGKTVEPWVVVDEGCNMVLPVFCNLGEGSAKFWANSFNESFCSVCGKKSHKALPMTVELCEKYCKFGKITCVNKKVIGLNRPQFRY